MLLKGIGIILIVIALVYTLYPAITYPTNIESPSKHAGFFHFTETSSSQEKRDFAGPIKNVDKSVETTTTATYEDVGVIYSYAELQAELCLKSIRWFSKDAHKRSNYPCPKNGIASVVFGGRTGNQMWEYAATWAVSRLTNLEAYIPVCIFQTLQNMFVNLTLHSFDRIAHCPVQFTTFVDNIEKWKFPNQNIILTQYVTEPQLVLPMVEDLVPEFQFQKTLIDKAQRVLLEYVNKLPTKNYTFIGVHVRRTDYVGYLNRKYSMKPVEPIFFTVAMDYYRQKYQNSLFVYISDDPKWCSRHFGHLSDVFLTSSVTKNSAAEDMALMAECNHSIFDYGTYGEWGAILAGGEAIYYDMEQNNKKGQFMKKWTKIKIG